MTNLVDPAFTIWLKSLPQLGYEPHWIGRNIPMLQRVYADRGGAPMAPCPPPSIGARDRYEEL